VSLAPHSPLACHTHLLLLLWRLSDTCCSRPGAFLDFIEQFGFISLDFIELTGAACVSEAKEGFFYLGFLVMVFLPLGLIALLALALWVLFSIFKARRPESRVLGHSVPFNAWVHFSFVLLFLLYPSVSYKVLSVLNCNEVDGTSYLVEDYTITCWEGEHVSYVVLGIIAIILYPVGIPLATFIVLVRHRRGIRHDVTVNELRRQRELRTKRRHRQHKERHRFRDTWSSLYGKSNKKVRPSAVSVDEKKFDKFMEELGAQNVSFVGVARFAIANEDPFGARDRDHVRKIELSKIETWWLSPDADFHREKSEQLYDLKDNIPLRFIVNHAFAIMSVARVHRAWGTEEIEFIDPNKVLAEEKREVLQHRYGTLYNDYKARAFMWEVVDMFRKMLLVGALVLVGSTNRGTPLQIGLGLLICVVALVVHAFVRPYVDQSTDIFQGVALTVLSLTLFAGLLLAASADEQGNSELQNDVLGGFLILINALVLVLAVLLISMKVHEVFRQIRDMRREMKEAEGDKEHGDDHEVQKHDIYKDARALESGAARVNSLGDIELVDMGKNDIGLPDLSMSAEESDSESDSGIDIEGVSSSADESAGSASGDFTEDNGSATTGGESS
jgi:Transient receptor potential (TRP) ion channel